MVRPLLSHLAQELRQLATMSDTAVHDSSAIRVDESASIPRQIHVVHVVRRGRAEGGMENGIVNVTNRLPVEFRVSIIALDSEQTFSSRIERPGTEYFTLPKQGSGIDWQLIWRLAQRLRTSEADLVHSHNWGTFIYSGLAAKLARIPIVHGEHGKNLGEVEGDGKAKRITKKILGRRTNQIVTVCQAIAEEWISYGVPAQKISCLPNGVDIDRFCPGNKKLDFREEFGIPSSAFLVGSVGRLDELKNYGVLIEALGILKDLIPEMHVAVLGDGPLRAQLAEQAASLGVADRTHLLGFRKQSEKFLAGLDIFVLPSKSEGMSNVVLEAMATGLAVICADLPSHHEIFQPGVEGEMLEPCMGIALANAIENLYRNPERRTAMALTARAKIVSKFSIERMVGDYARLYRQHALARVLPATVRIGS